MKGPTALAMGVVLLPVTALGLHGANDASATDPGPSCSAVEGAS